jgi:hypothetical protein
MDTTSNSTSNCDQYFSTDDVCLRSMRALTGLSKALSSLNVTFVSINLKIRVLFAIVAGTRLRYYLL